MTRMHPLLRLRKIIRECEQTIADIEYWNRNRTDEAPLDCEPERILIEMAKRCRRAWNKDRNEYERIAGEMAAYAAQIEASR